MRTDIVKSALVQKALGKRVGGTAPLVAPSAGPDLYEHALVVSAETPVLRKAQALVDLLGLKLSTLEDEAMNRLVDTIYPLIADPPSAVAVDQARRNAELRAEFERTRELLTAEQVHALCGSSAANRAALAARWRSERRVFGIRRQRRWLFPRFQFDEEHGRPKAAVRDVLRALGDAVGPWQTAIWFTSKNGWLDDRSPVDMLDHNPDQVVDAARAVSDPAEY